METKRIWFLVFIASLFLFGSFSSLSIFSDQEKDRLNVNIGTMVIGLNDQTLGQDGQFYPTEENMKVIPGSAVQKKVTAKNLGDYAIWLRIKPKPKIIAADGTLLPSVIESTDGTHIPLVSFTFSESEKWHRFLYHVSFSHDLNRAEYLSSHVEVVVQAHAVQAQNTGTSAEHALGWPSEEE